MLKQKCKSTKFYLKTLRYHKTNDICSYLSAVRYEANDVWLLRLKYMYSPYKHLRHANKFNVPVARKCLEVITPHQRMTFKSQEVRRPKCSQDQQKISLPQPKTINIGKRKYERNFENMVSYYWVMRNNKIEMFPNKKTVDSSHK